MNEKTWDQIYLSQGVQTIPKKNIRPVKSKLPIGRIFGKKHDRGKFADYRMK